MKHFLDITRETCPMTFVKVKLKLAQMDQGEPLENVPRSCEEQAYKVLSNEPTDDDKHLILIEK
ncbi:MAG: sulfurtransferase TusA family protein [Mariprofundus sp.]